MKKNYTTSDLFTLANQIRHEKNVSQKESFALAKAQLENIASAEVNTAEVTNPITEPVNEPVEPSNEVVEAPAPKTYKKRGNYVRDDAWKAKHAEQMRASWAARKAAKFKECA